MEFYMLSIQKKKHSSLGDAHACYSDLIMVHCMHVRKCHTVSHKYV